MTGATGLGEILLIAFFSLMVLLKLTETHQILEVKPLAIDGSPPQEIVLFAQVEMLIAPGYFAASFFLTSGAPKSSQALVSDGEKCPYPDCFPLNNKPSTKYSEEMYIVEINYLFHWCWQDF